MLRPRPASPTPRPNSHETWQALWPSLAVMSISRCWTRALFGLPHAQPSCMLSAAAWPSLVHPHPQLLCSPAGTLAYQWSFLSTLTRSAPTLDPTHACGCSSPAWHGLSSLGLACAGRSCSLGQSSLLPASTSVRWVPVVSSVLQPGSSCHYPQLSA